MRRLPSLRGGFLAICLMAAVSPCNATELGDVDAVPATGAEGRADYQAFLNAEKHRAFAIAPGGDWGMAKGQPSLRQAEDKAMEQCRAQTFQPCQLYAADDRVVFDQGAWTASWRALSAAAAALAPPGTAVGFRFPDLAVTAPDGTQQALSGLRGRVVLVHFWATWCGPCQRELPVLEQLYRQVQSNPRLAIVAIPVREPISRSRSWTALHDISLPLYDSGGQPFLRLANGGRLEDRRIAPKFPTTYILDPNGIVVFGQIGPVERWTDYAPLLLHLAETRALPQPDTPPAPPPKGVPEG